MSAYSQLRYRQASEASAGIPGGCVGSTSSTSGQGPSTQPSESLARQMTQDLRVHLALCEEAMALSVRENQALSGAAGYHASGFCQKRKNLLPRLEESLMSLRQWRHRWLQVAPEQRAGCPEVKALFSTVQGMLMKVLMLDRENQQALLRHGLLPARHLPATAVQQPHCVADLYRRHARR